MLVVWRGADGCSENCGGEVVVVFFGRAAVGEFCGVEACARAEARAFLFGGEQ